MRAVLVGGALFLLISVPAHAGNYLCNTDQMLPPEQILLQLAGQGYGNIRDLQLDDCLYEARATDRRGDRWELQVNPKDGRVIGKERDNFFD